MLGFLVLRFLLIICFLSLCIQTNALGSLNYYQATVPVRSQSKTDRQYAAQKGLQEVLVRMNGSESVLQNAQVKAAVRRAQSYIEQFQYRQIKEEALVSKGYKQEMQLTFSPELIERLLLRQAQVRYWPTNRPQILVWLVEDNAQAGRQMLNRAVEDPDGKGNPIVKALDKAALERGLPIEYPLLDLDDQLAITADKLWRMDEDSILAASQRYDAAVILLGRFSRTSKGEIWSTWQFHHAGKNQVWDSRASEIDKLAWEALSPLTDFLAERYAIVPSGQNAPDLVLQLSGINTFKDYRQALDYLNGLAMISDVSLLEVQTGEMLLALHSEASLNKFKTAVQLDRKIKPSFQQSELPAWQQLPEGTMENPVRFSWQSR